MKALKYILSLTLVFFISCAEDDNDLSFIESIAAPANVSALFQISQDNSGLVNITPNSEGAVSYNVTFGDDTAEPVNVKQGDNIDHTYSEGTYTVTIEAVGLTDLKTVATQQLVVSFRAPENLEITAAINPSNPFIVDVSATADFAASFQVFFDTSNIDEEPTPLAIDETVSFEYPSVGDYTIKVVALSGGTETVETTQVVTISKPTELPIDFEIFDNTVLGDFGGATIAVVDNPQVDAVNGSAKVAQIIKGAGETWAGNVITMSTPIDLSTKQLIKMNVWSPRAGGKMTLKLENLSDQNIFFEKEITTVGNSDWEEVVFDVSDIDLSQEYQKIVLFFDFGMMGDGSSDWTFFIDNIKQEVPPVSGGGNNVTPINFETPFELSSFDGGGISLIANPDTNGNPSSTVAEMIKGAGQVWAGSKITVPTPFNFDNSTTVTIKVWSPRAGLNLLAKFEDNVPWPDVTATAEITATTTVANQWEDLTFDFTGIDTSIDWYNLVLIMDNGAAGDGSANYTIYLDDISTDPVLDFEPKFTLSSFDGGGISVIANPDTNGNPSNMVAEMIKGAGEVWAGSKITAPKPFSFDGGTTLTIKVWSPRAGLNLLAKFEDDVPWPDVTATAEITATTTVASQWEDLTFDFAGIDTSIDWYNLVLIMDNGAAGDGSSNYTIYLDDIDIN
ncbi:hypothetical protein [Flavivirga algicola]|uniref:PKD domain-containing protein n=1 Tax=Flavivirga algicola TaxID=2729136 RepID=A0ABX1S3N6_9FLAO|nr:hypothetical protein [Flavivirga algicola]NMH89683.1 hypothetical protein [Flavivirga algicola]